MIDMLIRLAGLLTITCLGILITIIIQDAFGVVRNGLEGDDEFNEDED